MADEIMLTVLRAAIDVMKCLQGAGFMGTCRGLYTETVRVVSRIH